MNDGVVWVVKWVEVGWSLGIKAKIESEIETQTNMFWFCFMHSLWFKNKIQINKIILKSGIYEEKKAYA